MIPSLVANEIQDALIEYLASTFSLADDETRDALSAFLTDNADGIFRGPYLRVRTPFRRVHSGWDNPLDWLPSWFAPYAHQAAAFERLSTAGGREPEPTLVTTGTGSGKTECFLMPVLDHCARARSAGQDGIKTIILYPMNALASDQAGRLANLIHTEAALSGLRAGLYVGGNGRHSDMGQDHLIDKREALRANPPDILLTNYKMLDLLLLREADRDLWAVNEPSTLQYIVLDEFHTYDGAQGTDVAMLMRRLRARLDPGADSAATFTPVATSATLGSGPFAVEALCTFASKVFGVDFDPDAVIGETRQSIDEACLPVNFNYPVPEVEDVVGLTDLNDVATAFCVNPDEPTPVATMSDLGERLQAHTLTRAVLSAVNDQTRSWDAAVTEIVSRAPNWGRAHMINPDHVERALAQFLWLLSEARRDEREPGGGSTPLFTVEVQLWIREVTRMQRSVDPIPSFRWRDSGTTADEDGSGPVAGGELPAIYCRRCGASGWMALRSETNESFRVNPARISNASLQRSPLVRALVSAHPDDPQASRYSPSLRRLDPTEPDGVPVLINEDEDDARNSRCPACNERHSIRFLGLAVASLASVSINTLFSSPHLEENERKLIAFTDSVQDASHRASFFGGRTHRINLRALMARVIRNSGQAPESNAVQLADLETLVWQEADTARDRFGLVPPDLTMHSLISTAWTGSPVAGAVELLRARLGFEADLEFGSRARVGRTLELSLAAAASVVLDNDDAVSNLTAEIIEHETGAGRPSPAQTTVYLRGLLERLRLRGGLVHPLLDQYMTNNGDQWWVWGGRPDGLPPFTPDQGRPSFFTTASRSSFDSVTSAPTTPTWLLDWARRTLSARGLAVAGPMAKNINERVLAVLGAESDTVVATRTPSGTVYGLDRRFVALADIAAATPPMGLRCTICGHRHVADAARWVGTPCLRYRCVGVFETLPWREENYYRQLYRSGRTRRVVAAEHTGLLQRGDREDLEQAFKQGTLANAPNVLTATPTLEMGIDIGDLSAVMLTSVPRNPASYVQRVGRSGRLTGNSLVTTFVQTDTHGLYYLADPEAMLAGDVRPPSCYLDATETLQRQYFAYLIDRIADQTIEAPPMPPRINALMSSGLDEGTFLRAVIDASAHSEGRHVDAFLARFGDAVSPGAASTLRHFAVDGIEHTVTNAKGVWDQHKRDLELRRNRLKGAIERAEASEADAGALGSLRGQRAAIIRLLQDHRNENTLSALVRLGLLPNYNLMDDAVTLTATLWYPVAEPEGASRYETTAIDYQRAGHLAVSEFAPGNSFYAGGHRHVIDALEIGAAEAPLYEAWRLCKECGFAMIEPAGEAPATCPRCGDHGMADTGSRFLMLRLRGAYASNSEEGARVYDETDDRRRERYSMGTLVDVDPSFVAGAWQLPGRSFGAEFAGRTHVRTINFGFADRPSEGALRIGGADRHVTRFAVCAYCGAVVDARDDQNGTRPDRLHQGWCTVRSGKNAPSFDAITLFHELTTEALRIAVPVSMFEVEERLASFTGSLLLGLRQELGGNPDHLQVVRADAPNASGQGRRRFLVIYDTVPGSTGYLTDLAQPDRFRAVLEAGRDVIARCPCAAEGRSACHRCLLGVVGRNEYDLARRDLALDILDGLLDDESWTPEETDTIAGIDIGKVEESELERRFKLALQDWAASTPGDAISCRKVPGIGRHEAFELRLGFDGASSRYRLAEQEGLSNIASTLPDFHITRQDSKGPEVAVYLDGYQFHASPENNNISDDAAKRRTVRERGGLVWNLSWEDVTRFHDAVTSDPPRAPAPRTMLTGAAKRTARAAHQGAGGRFDMDAIDQNPMALLLDFLARPDLLAWEQTAQSAAAGLLSVATDRDRYGRADARELLAGALAGDELVPDGASDDAESPANTDGELMAGSYTTSNGLRIWLGLNSPATGHAADKHRWTAVAALADDRATVAEPENLRRWQDWLQWANVLQFLRSPGQAAIISATSEAPDLDLDNVDLVPANTNTHDAPSTVELDADMLEDLGLIDDDDVRVLAEKVLKAGADRFVPGHELSGLPLEVAWPDAKVAIVISPDPAFDNQAPSFSGWDARTAADWSAEELIAVLKARS